MNRTEFGQQLNLAEDLIAIGRRNRPETPLAPTFITIHNTDNPSAGADALAHARFLKMTGYYIHPRGSGNKVWVSWHYTVDDFRIIKHIPISELAFHAKSGNSKSIGIEICMNAGINQNAANLRAARLVAALMFDLGIGIDKVVPHNKWTGKQCPSLLMDADKTFNVKWGNFKNMILAEFGSIDV
ncbi:MULTISPECIES: N-acetylmuramoyl-L-alanine amidase family protein [Emticicia]|uniref:peptidoglycan recognition protein family protein n=1 Tax=Emticicia TaxID=312278 RepID=UPI0007D8CA29|nr:MULTISPECIES: N-acetylmuramoyl-L-alanine amidase [Emticicia]